MNISHITTNCDNNVSSFLKLKWAVIGEGVKMVEK